MRHLMGVDIGSFSAKGVLLDERGRIVAYVPLTAVITDWAAHESVRSLQVSRRSPRRGPRLGPDGRKCAVPSNALSLSKPNLTSIGEGPYPRAGSRRAGAM